MNNLKNFLDFINESGDYYGDPPEPDSLFYEVHEEIILQLETELLQKGHDVPDDLIDRLIAANLETEWDEALSKKFAELHDKEFSDGHDEEHDAELYKPIYHKITEDVKKTKEYRKASFSEKTRMIREVALGYLLKKHAEELWKIYDEYIKKLEPKEEQ